MCRSQAHGGLGLRSLLKLKEETNLKLSWDLLTRKEDYENIFEGRVFKSYGLIKHHIFSSLSSSVKLELCIMNMHSYWSLRNGKSILVWQDVWCGSSFLLETYAGFLTDLDIYLNSKVVDFITNGVWCFHADWHTYFIFIHHRINSSLCSFLTWKMP